MDIASELRARDDVGVKQKFFIYLADCDRNNQPIADFQKWIDRAIVLMVRINGGCTVLPPATGAWKDSATGTLIRENTTVIYSFIMHAERFEKKIKLIKNFLHAYGIETDQDEVMAEMSGWNGEHYACEAYYIPHENYEAVGISGEE